VLTRRVLLQEHKRQAQMIAAATATRLASSLHAKINAQKHAASEAARRSEASQSASMVVAAQSAAGQIAGRMGWQQDSSLSAARVTQLRANLARASAMGGALNFYESELVVNDFAQSARYHVTHRDTLAKINELTGAAVTVRGRYYAPGQPVPADDRKLWLLIEGPSEQHVKAAKQELKRLIEERTEKSMRQDAPASGRYRVT